jgi:hypothetical protein
VESWEIGVVLLSKCLASGNEIIWLPVEPGFETFFFRATGFETYFWDKLNA